MNLSLKVELNANQQCGALHLSILINGPLQQLPYPPISNPNSSEQKRKKYQQEHEGYLKLGYQVVRRVSWLLMSFVRCCHHWESKPHCRWG
jgi:hypothetical protein